MTVQPGFLEKGFTLVELLIVVAIIGILSALMLPNYSKYMDGPSKAEVKSLMLEIMQKQQQYFVQELTYTDDLRKLGYDEKSSVKTDSEAYSVVVHETCSDGKSITRCVRLTSARQVSGQSTPVVEYSLESNGNRTPASDWD